MYHGEGYWWRCLKKKKMCLRNVFCINFSQIMYCNSWEMVIFSGRPGIMSAIDQSIVLKSFSCLCNLMRGITYLYNVLISSRTYWNVFEEQFPVRGRIYPAYLFNLKAIVITGRKIAIYPTRPLIFIIPMATGYRKRLSHLLSSYKCQITCRCFTHNCL